MWLGRSLYSAQLNLDLPAQLVFASAEGEALFRMAANPSPVPGLILTTGAAAENLKRNWISVEANRDYIIGSRGRFKNPKEKNVKVATL
jgi:hypothetical protein